jgi:oligosaccharyltransferase complex subunit beta
MLDPHVRTALKESSSSTTATTYKSTFVAPDRHGVFKFVVEYWRPGYSFIRTSTTAPVVPFRHDEYPRFITGAWPYYLSTASIVAAFGLFCALWLTTAEDKVRGGKKIE